MKKMFLLTTGLVAGGLLCSAAAFCHEQGDWFVRAGVAAVDPNESSSTISTQNTGVLPDTSVGLDSNTQLGLNIGYMLTDNIGIELLAATPFEHNIRAKGLSRYGFATTDLGSTKHLPPTLSVQYYFGNTASTVRPYVGAGLNYTTFFSESLSRQAKTELGGNDLKLEDSTGLAGHAGIDWKLNEQWFVNASVWRMDISTKASLNSALGKVKVDVDVDPWAYMVAVGYTF